MGATLEVLKAFSPARLAAMGAVALGLIGFFAFLMLRFSQPAMAPLFTDLTFEDSAAIVKELESRAVPYEIKGEGAVVLVPKEEVLRLRMGFAESGLPAGGVVGYEIFDRSDTLGTTSFVQNVNHLRALEGELSRTIRAIDRVQLARVHLVLPERQLFVRDAPEPSASIVLRLRGALETAQIRAIQHLVASAVNGLKPERVSIVDESGTLLASGRGGEEADLIASTLQERTRSYEERLRTQIQDILTSVVGPQRARVQVAAELDHNRVTETAEIFDPESRVVRSTQTREELSNAKETRREDGVTVANELPNADGALDAPGTQENASKSEEIVNYEISRTARTQVLEAGRVKRLSVAVLVDGLYTKGTDGTVTYEPRPAEQLEQITALVRSTMGYDESRGDQVQVVNLRFAEAAAPLALEEEPTVFLGLTRAELMDLAELAFVLLLALLVLLIVVRPLVKRILAPEETSGSEEAQPALTGETMPALPSPDVPQLSDGRAAEMINIAKINGELQASTVQSIGELVENNPEEAVMIVRQWLHEAA